MLGKRVPTLNIIKVFTVVLLLLATTGLFKFVQRYEPCGTELLQNANFQQGLTYWKVHGARGAVSVFSGIVTLKNSDASRSVSIRQTLPVPSGQSKLMLMAEVSTEGVEGGVEPWHKASLYLVGRNRGGEFLWKHSHMVMTLEGTRGWRCFSQVFPVIEEAVEFVVGIELGHATGMMQVRNLSLVPVKELSGFGIAVYGLLTCWCAVFLWVGISIIRSARPNIAYGFLIVVMVFIIFSVLVPGPMKTQFLGVLQGEYAKLISFLSAELPWAHDLEGVGARTMPFALDKMGHFTLFAILAIFMRLARPKDWLVAQVLYLMLFAATTEVLQFFTIERGPRVGDWLFDVSGLAFGLVLITFIRGIKKVSIK